MFLINRILYFYLTLKVRQKKMELETKSNDTEETYRTRTDDVTGQAQQVFLIHLFLFLPY